MNTAFKNIQIRFQTALEMPPPYAHFYTLLIQPVSDSGLQVSFSITYTDREDIDADEIIAEGFTLDDDFEWKGKLPTVWLSAVSQLVGKTRLRSLNPDKLPEDRDFMELTLTQDSETVGQPANQDDWQYLAQELIQAIYESAQREKPFELTYVDIQRGNAAEIRLTASFVRREVVVRNGQRTKNIPWSDLQSIISTVYSVQYLYEEAVTKVPKREGQFINLGEDEWFELGRAVVDMDEPGGLTDLRKMLRQLVS